MQLKTKRDWLYFFRQLFLYIIPMLLIFGSVDVFIKLIQCKAHPERSASCGVLAGIPAIVYALCILISIVCYIIFAGKLHKVKKQIEAEFNNSIQCDKSNNGINNGVQLKNKVLNERKKHTTKTMRKNDYKWIKATENKKSVK